MATLKPNNPELAELVKDLTIESFEPAYLRYVGEFEQYPYEYTTDPEAVGIVEAAVLVRFTDGNPPFYFKTSEVLIG